MSHEVNALEISKLTLVVIASFKEFAAGAEQKTTTTGDELVSFIEFAGALRNAASGSGRCTKSARGANKMHPDEDDWMTP
jgi:hypothetical protein